MVLVLATVGILVLDGVLLLMTLIGGAMTMPVVLWAVAAAAVVAGAGPAPRTVALLAVAGTIVAAVAATHDWSAVLAC